MNRAYSLLEIKAVKDDERIIEGTATTPSPDRVGDVVDPMGARFNLPLPLLWQHDKDQPIGEVFFARPNKTGIPFKARIASIDEPGRLKDRLDEAWQSTRIGLVRGISIGFSIADHEVMPKTGGWRITDWEWLETSIVTIPANSEATIDRIKSIDAEVLAASGQAHNGGARTVSAGVTASRNKSVNLKETKMSKPKSYAEQITALEATRQAKAARREEIQNTAAEDSRTKDEAERVEFDELGDSVKTIDRELVDLRELEKHNKAAAVPAVGSDQAVAATSRSASRA
jgi:HK97 family phage prohead protease